MGQAKDDLAAKCICPKCPTYDECARKGKELLYCMRGKSSCSLKKYGCICFTCPVEKIKAFSGVFFCQSGKVELK